MSSASRQGSWYLDPCAARQKRAVHRDLVRRWTAELRVANFLKTDVFEEANGEDDILFDLFPPQVAAIGMDRDEATAARAARRLPASGARFLVCDARQPAIRCSSLDLIVSTSTLDHMDRPTDLLDSLRALHRLLRPGGELIVTLDNLENPLYRPLRWAGRRGWLPFRLGYTVSMAGLNRALSDCGFEVVANDFILHNPRVAGTLLFLGLRKLLGRRADGPIRVLLSVFALFGRTPMRRWTACFVAASARRPASGPLAQAQD